MKATYNPQNPDRISTKLRDCIGKPFDFKPARPVDGVPRYWPNDILFPGAGPVPENDLEFETEQREIYCHKCSSICKAVYHLPGACEF